MAASKLKQVILVRSDLPKDNVMDIAIAKASMLQVVRTFGSAKDIVDKLDSHESNAFQQLIQQWVDSDEMKVEIVYVEDAETMSMHQWTSEMIGIHTTTVNMYGTPYCMVIGPAIGENIDEFLYA